MQPGIKLQDQDSVEVKLQTFRNKTLLPPIEAKLYLEDHDWDVDAAVAACLADNAWEQEALEKKAEQERLAKLIAEEQVAVSPGNSTDRASGPVVVRGIPIHKKDVEMKEVVSAKPVGVVGQSGVGSEAQAEIHAIPS
eukprot:FR741280.1.p1 GENE.FR741280.1~~FR741280.1.p1  ORF type:complete len:147 (+),score=22.63 FR741280.1:30-443(+)